MADGKIPIGQDEIDHATMCAKRLNQCRVQLVRAMQMAKLAEQHRAQIDDADATRKVLGVAAGELKTSNVTSLIEKIQAVMNDTFDFRQRRARRNIEAAPEEQ